LERQLPGLSNLLDSFSSLLVQKSQFNEEWNPFSQRPVTHAVNVDNPTKLENSIQAVNLFIEASHEATHILLWEPFFAGTCRPGNPKELIFASLIFEAYCFWYADIIVTRNLRTRLPDGEFARVRSAISQPDFHPYRAFKAINIVEPSEILNIYFHAFMGGDSPLYRHRQLPYVEDLLRRFINFYVTASQPVNALFKILDHVGIFEEFYGRFCRLSGIPSLLPDSLLKMDIMANPISYCHSIRKNGYKHIEHLSPKTISQVRMRRFIQMRAYYAYSLLYALKANLVFSRKNKSFNGAELKRNLAQYIDVLETAIQALCKGGNLKKIEQICRHNDQVYSRRVKKAFSQSDLWMNQRLCVTPYLNTRSAGFGIVRGTVSPSERIKLGEHLLNRYCPDKIDEAAKGKTLSSRRLGQKIGTFMKANSTVGVSQEKWKSAFNALLLDEQILELWSVRLGSIDPEENQFRDPLFVYI
jgi:hypothetical protein